MTERELQLEGERFCNIHILADQTDLVNKLISLDVIDTYSLFDEHAEVFDTITNRIERMTRDEYNELYFEYNAQLSEIDENTTDEYTQKKRMNLIEFLDTDPIFDTIEIFTWYLVSNYLENLLEKKGEIILRTEYGNWWGKQCMGQSLHLDDTFCNIIKEQTE